MKVPTENERKMIFTIELDSLIKIPRRTPSGVAIAKPPNMNFTSPG